MIVYISGKITGTKNYKRKFAKAERELKRKGFDVINPARMNACMPKSCDWDDYMTVSIAELDCSDAIYMLKDWKDSKGATVEHRYAMRQKKTVMYEVSKC